MNSRHILTLFFFPVILASCTDNKAPSGGTEVQEQNDSVSKDNSRESLFITNCAGCHGSDGTAGIGKAANLQTSILDSAALGAIIRDGKGAMPSFKSQLTDAEIQNLSEYVQTLRR